MKILNDKTISKLKWTIANTLNEENLLDLINNISRTLNRNDSKMVYTTGRRHVYRAHSNSLGELAIKEINYPSVSKQIKTRLYKEPKAAREFKNAQEYIRRGGITHAIYGLAIDQSLFRLKRVFIIMEWLSETITLTELLQKNNGSLDFSTWEKLAKHLVSSAYLGLIHNGHSSDNILLTENNNMIQFFIIDFADAFLYEKSKIDFFAKDIARIAFTLLSRKACGKEETTKFINIVDAEIKKKNGNSDFAVVCNKALESALCHI